MLQQDKPDDFVVATGETHSVREFTELAFKCAGLNWKDHTVVDKIFYRPSEVNFLQGNPAKAKKILGWEPKVKFARLVKIMVESDLEALSKYK
jgi:GDPmannose 4,6-dehydratase